MRKELTHHFLCFFLCQVLSGQTVYLVGELSAVVNHLFHSHVLCELAVFVAIDAVIFVLCAVGIRTFVVVVQRHSAALAKFLFHIVFYFCSTSKGSWLI